MAAWGLEPGRHPLFGRPSDQQGDATPVATLDVDHDRVVLQAAHHSATGQPGETKGWREFDSFAIVVDDAQIRGRTDLTHGQVIELDGQTLLFEDRLAEASSRGAQPVVIPPAVSVPAPGWTMVILAGLLVAVLAVLVAFVNVDLWPALLLSVFIAGGTLWIRQRDVEEGNKRQQRLLDRRRARFAADLAEARAMELSYRRRGSYPSMVIGDIIASDPAPPEPVPVAVGTIVWEPELDERGPLDRSLSRELADLEILHSAQMAIEPMDMLVGLVGPTTATRGVANQILLSLAAREGAPQLDIRCCDNPEQASHWAPLGVLASVATSEAQTTYRVFVGPISAALPDRPRAGLMIAGDESELPFEPDLLFSIDEDGTAQMRAPNSGITTTTVWPLGASELELETANRRLANGDRETGSANDPSSIPLPSRLTQDDLTEAERESALLALAPPPLVIPGPVLLSASSPAEARGHLVAIATDLANSAFQVDRPAYFILSARDDELAALAGLDELHRPTVSATATLPDSIEELVAAWQSARDSGRSVAFLALRLGEALAELAHNDRVDLANELLDIVRDCRPGVNGDARQGFAAIIEPRRSTLPQVVIDACDTRIGHRNGEAVLITRSAGQLLLRPRETIELEPDEVEAYVRDRLAFAAGD